MAYQSVAGLAKEASAPIPSTSASNSAVLYPQLESTVAPLDKSEKYDEIVKIEKDLIKSLKETVINQTNPEEILKDISQNVRESKIFPLELITSNKKLLNKRIKEDLTKRLQNLPINEEVEDEEGEQEEDEEVTDEEALVDDDEDDDAGGDYAVSHFDNGEGFEDNDDEGDDMASTM